MVDTVKSAKVFATQAHRRIDQVRKYSGQPYDVHLKAVAQLVAGCSDDPELIAAAWLHDVVEDTPATRDDLRRAFGPAITGLVEQLTDVSRPSDGNRSARMAMNRKHLAGASARAKTVKLADLIDNCRDICKHDPKFARTFLAEMASLLEVLGDGDARLLVQAQKTLSRCSEKLGLGKTILAGGQSGSVWSPFEIEISTKHGRALRKFARAFTASDLAEDLKLVKGDTPSREAARVLSRENTVVAGVLQGNLLTGYVRLDDLKQGRCSDSTIPFREEQMLDAQAALPDVIEVLTRHEYGFIRAQERVGAVLSRPDIQKPIARMWLFGMITVLELYFANRIKSLWPKQTWKHLLSPHRLRQAESVHAERIRLGQQSELEDCLQLLDKAEVLLQNPGQLQEMGFETRGSVKQVMKDIQSLRNNLAHAQDIVVHDWPQIVRLARRLERLVEESRSPP